MPSGKITKIVHLSLQSSFSTESSPQPKGYGYLRADSGGEDLYFAPKAVKDYSFDDLQVGQEVEFEEDAKTPMVKTVALKGAIFEPPTPQSHLE
ncbi:MAG: cold shock domain-containing protein [Pirellulales bacterium]|nr:cold shock domain-containing protein [Pirellulales bacterium]